MNDIINELTGLKITKLIHFRASHSTNSVYGIAKTNTGHVITFSFSDHSHDSHSYDISSFHFDFNNIFQAYQNEFDNQVHHLKSLKYFGYTFAKPYQKSDVINLIKRYNLDRSFSNNDYKILKASLSYNNQLLTCQYESETTYHINYLPKVTTDNELCQLAHISNKREFYNRVRNNEFKSIIYNY